jgi:hypothetical protein
VTTTIDVTDHAVDTGHEAGRDGLAREGLTLTEAVFVSVATMAPGVGAALAVVTGSVFAGGALPRRS